MDSAINNLFQENFTIFPPNLIKQFKNYKVSDRAFILLLYLIEQKVKSLSIADLNETFGWTIQDISQYLHELVEQHLIEINMEKHMGKYDDQISLVPFFKQIESHYQKESEIDTINLDLSQYELIPTFEKEFKTSLTTFQLQEIARWKKEEGFSDELILLALQQAVVNGVLNIRYIDRILSTWKRKNIMTYEEAKIDADEFNKKKLDSKNIDEEFIPFEIPKVDWKFI